MRVHLKMGKALLRSMEHADLDRVMQIEKASFPKNLLEEEIIVYLIFSNLVGAVVEYDGEIVAFMLCRREHGLLHLDDIAVAPSHRGHGLAKMMVGFLQKELGTFKCKRLLLSVQIDNEAAKKLYAKFGFEQYGFVANAYHEGEGGHAILMHYSLPGATGEIPVPVKLSSS